MLGLHLVWSLWLHTSHESEGVDVDAASLIIPCDTQNVTDGGDSREISQY